MQFLSVAVFIGFLINGGDSTISPGDKMEKLFHKTGPRRESVFDLQLVDKEPSAKDILVNSGAYCKDTDSRRFNGTVLGFVTPWNSYGYEIVNKFKKKFDIISPVWFRIVLQDGDYKVDGFQAVDASWIKNVRKNILLFPRFIFDNFSVNDFTLLLSAKEEILKVSKLLERTCKQNEFDGVVLEYWTQFGGRVANSFLLKFALLISKTLAQKNVKMILITPPIRPGWPNIFNNYHIDTLYEHIYAFSLTTYDFSSVQRPGANSPLHWIKQSVEHLVPDDAVNVIEKRKKILMGTNMYGNDYTPDGGGPIVASQYLDLLRSVRKRLSYDELNVENFFETRTHTGRHYVFYPTLYSLNERIKLAEELGVGISIWELGQGLNYFYDLF